jgi:hypothetical protein
MNKLRRFLSIGVMVMTIFATVGACVPTSQAAASAGDLIKMDGLSSVYYLGSDGKRYVFPNEATYMSWYNDFSGVVTIPASELQSYPLGGNVTMRPGTKLVKITTDPSVYAVEPNGVLRKIQSEAQAAALYGSNWNKRIVDLADAFFTNYTISSPLPSGSIPAGSLVKTADSADVYYYDGTNYRAFTNEAAFNANRFSFSNVITVSNVVSGGTAISSAEFVDVAQGGTTSGPVVTGSGLMVSLSAATPASQSIPNQAGRIPMAKVNLTAANDGAVNVDTITITRSGLTSYTTKQLQVFAEKDGIKVANEKSFVSNEAVLVFNPTLTIPAGQTVSLDILAKTDGASGNVAYGIASASAVSASSAAVTGSFPITGNLMSITTYEVDTLNATLQTGSTSVNVGDEDAELVKIDLDLVKNRDVVLTSLELKNEGSENLADVLSNVHLEKDGKIVSNTASMNGKYLTFTFPGNGLEITDGGVTLSVRADVIAMYESTSNIKLGWDSRSSNSAATEKATGFGVTFNPTIGTKTITIEAGDVTISRTKNSPLGTKSYVKGTTGILALEAKFETVKDLDIDNMVIVAEFTQGASTSYDVATSSFRNIKVKLDNTTLGSFSNFTEWSALDTNKKATTSVEDFAVTKGVHTISILVDTHSTIADGSKVKFSIAGKDIHGVYIENDIDIKVTGEATGAAIKAEADGSLKVSFADTTKSGIVIADGTEQEIAKFKIHSENDEMIIEEIEFVATSTSEIATTSNERLHDIVAYLGSTELGSNVKFDEDGIFSTSTIKISGDKLKIKAGETKEITIKGIFPASYSEEAIASNTIQLALNAIKTKSGDGITEQEEVNVSKPMTVYKVHPLFSFKKGYVGSLGKTQQYLEFTVTAKGTGELRIDELGYELYGTASGTTVNLADVSLYVDGDKVADATKPAVVIAAGSSGKTFVVKVDTRGMAKDETFGISLKESDIKWGEGISFNKFSPKVQLTGTSLAFPIDSGLYSNK